MEFEIIDEINDEISGGIHEFVGAANSVEMAELARFAVDEHNKKENTMVEFGKVINAKHQGVAGTIYYITLEAKDGDKKKVYEAKVWDKIQMLKELLEFKLLSDA